MSNYNYEIITSSSEDKNLLNELNSDIAKYSLMANYERQFLTSLVRQKKPKKILEIGVNAGGSSAVMLNALKDVDDCTLYSIDICVDWNGVPGKKTGFYMDNYPELKKKWKLYTGGITVDYIDEIGKDIDFCFIDTVHSNPGEILDILMVLPYLKDDATLVFHDTNLQLYHLNSENKLTFEYTNNLLMSAVNGKKLIPYLFSKTDAIYNFPNIGAIEINPQSIIQNIWDIFNLLAIKWEYMLSDKDIASLSAHFKKYYGQEFSEFFEEITNNMKNKYYIRYTPPEPEWIKALKEKEQKLTPLQKLFTTFKVCGKRIVVFFGKKYVRI